MIRYRAEVFCEDSGHERLTRTLVERLAEEQSVSLDVNVRSGRGGKGKAISELRAFQAQARVNGGSDLLVVMIDANGDGWARKRAEIEEEVAADVFAYHAIGCPDPHVEKWLFADAAAYSSVVGLPPPALPSKEGKDVYKRLLGQSLDKAGIVVLTGPMEIASEIIAAMNLNQFKPPFNSLSDFVKSIRNALKQLHE